MKESDRKKKPSMHDIAAMSGTSTSTVSRVMNGGYVSAKVREKILSAISELNYSPKYLPNRLSRVCILLRHGFAAPYSDRVLPALSRELTQKKLQTLVLSEPSGDEDWMIQSIQDLRPDILVCLGRLTQEYMSLEAELKGVIQISDWESLAQSAKIAYFSEDMWTYGQSSVEYLYKWGHRHILLIHRGQTYAGSRNLYNGFASEAEKRGIQISDLVVPIYEGEGKNIFNEKVSRLFDKSSRERATACVLARSSFTLPLYRALHKAGFSVPDDVSIIGREVDNRSEYLNPPLTTYRHDHDELSRYVCDAIQDFLHNKDPKIKSRRVAPTLIERCSVAAINGV